MLNITATKNCAFFYQHSPGPEFQVDHDHVARDSSSSFGATPGAGTLISSNAAALVWAIFLVRGLKWLRWEFYPKERKKVSSKAWDPKIVPSESEPISDGKKISPQ